MVGVSPSASLASTWQSRPELLVTPLLGLMEKEFTTGAVLITVTDAALQSLPPWASEAVAVQRMLSPGELVELVSVRVD